GIRPKATYNRCIVQPIRNDIMKTLIALIALLPVLACAQSGTLTIDKPIKAKKAYTRCIALSVCPQVNGKLDSSYSYVKHTVLQQWPYRWQMPDGSNFGDKKTCDEIIEVLAQEPYWKEPKKYTYKEFKTLIYGK